MGLNAVAPSPTLTVGGQVFTDLDNLICLVGGTVASANTVCSLRLPNGTAGYTVPVGKVLVVKAIKHNARGAASVAPSLFYCDNDLGLGSTTAPTNAVYYGGDAGNSYTTLATAGTIFEMALYNFEIPAGKYVSMGDQDAGGSMSVQLYGYLKDE